MKTIKIFMVAAISTMILAGCDVKELIYDATYEIMIANDGHGTGEARVGDASADKCVAGATVTITATPTGDYAFKQWVVVSGGVTLSPDASANPATFAMPARAVEIRAEFEAISRTITMTDDGNGTAVANPANAAVGTPVTITATPTGDYAFKQWVAMSGGITLSSTATNPATFTMGNEPVEIRAEFEAISRTITMSNDGNGTAVANPADATAGTLITITATPTGGFTFRQWTVISGGVTLSRATDSPTIFTMGTQSVEIKAEFITTPTLYNEVGSGTESEPWLIYNGAQLADLAATVNAGTDMDGKYFKQMTDVSLVDYSNWTPIGKDATTPFRGNYDGNSRQLNDLSIDIISPVSGTIYRLGVFGYMDAGEIMNISIAGAASLTNLNNNYTYPSDMVLGKMQCIGGVVGVITGTAIVSGSIESNVAITLTPIQYLSNAFYAGGAIGYSDHTLSGVQFSGSPAISVGVDGVAIGYAGYWVSFCVNNINTESVNSRNDVDNPTITITLQGGLATLYINGF